MKFFMREEFRKEEILEIPGLNTFCDDKGEPIPLKIKVLGVDEINKIRKNYTTTKIVIDDKGKRVFDKSGKPLMATECDNMAATNRMIVESLLVPNLKDPEMMAFYDCKDVVEMPMKVFKKPKDYTYVSKQITIANGIDDEDMSDDELVEEAKN